MSEEFLKLTFLIDLVGVGRKVWCVKRNWSLEIRWSRKMKL
jgi:hypothetical protein